MASSNQGSGRVWTSGRSFAAMDPERQREVVVAIGGGPLEAEARRGGSLRNRHARGDWMRVQPDRDSSSFEGSSSRRGR